MAGVVALVLLRVSVGWHFLYQGIWKLENPNFTSEPFLRQAKGPFAEHFYEMIPDHDGRERLNPEATAKRWQALYERWLNFYGVDGDQQKAGEAMLRGRIQQHEEFLAINELEIEEYLNELDRLAKLKTKNSRGATDYQRKREWDLRKRLEAEVKPWLAEVDQIRDGLEADLASLLSDDQRARGDFRDDSHSMASVDHSVTLSNIVIGGCLMLGLFTRLAAAGGAIFLLSIVMAQPELPWIYPPAPPSAGRALLVNKEFVEMIALVTLAAVPAGRWGGLDFFIYHFLHRFRSGKRKDHESYA